MTTGDVVHFLTGKCIGAGKLKDSSPLLLDFLELGNFGVSADELGRTSEGSQRRFYEVLIASMHGSLMLGPVASRDRIAGGLREIAPSMMALAA